MEQPKSPPSARPDLQGYDVGQHLYESMSSAVFRANRRYDQRPVVLKLLKPDLPEPDALGRYEREFELMGHLDGPGILRAYGLERYRQTVVLVLEDFAGFSLDHWLKQWAKRSPAGLTVPLFLQLAIRMAEALGQVHAGGVVHRDINPSNLVYEPETKVLKVIDFGLATPMRQKSLQNDSATFVQGTLAYLSPEQTGRTSHPVDHRTDLYSLGVTFYEMLTGRLPFQGEDPLGLVHAHLAKIAPRVTDLKPEVPPVLSDLIMRLLAKAPADRYQSAFGVKEDLARCLADASGAADAQSATLPSFELGTRDDHCLLAIPDTLYGRSASTATALQALERVCAGGRSLLLVTGPGGVGKSALVAELRDPVRQQGGYFVSGKFDEYVGSTPYAGWVQAFERWVALALTEPEERLARWRTDILNALGANAGALTEVFPCLEQVLGQQPAPPSLGPQEARNRFDLVFRTFVKTICTAECPLVLFVDDWQWADTASLALLSLLATDETLVHLMLAGAYRDGALGQDHPLEMLRAHLVAGNVPFETVKLSDLERGDVIELVQDSLRCGDETARALGELVYAKTRGNPFFARQFLRSICDEGCLSFDFHAHQWTWDAARITSHVSADNVVALVAERLEQLPPPALRLLQIAACLGSAFRADTIAAVAEVSPRAVLDGLRQAALEGLVVALDQNQRGTETSETAHFAFLHDRVRQACYGKLDEQARQDAHLRIARALHATTPATGSEHRLFAIAQHYQKADGAVHEAAEKASIAELCVRAANLACDAGAFASATEYLEYALRQMPTDAWITRYDAMLKTHSMLATCLALTGATERLETVCLATESQARTAVDASGVKKARVLSLLGRAQHLEAIARTLDFIESLGVSIPRDPSPEEALGYFAETAEWLTEERIRGLPDLPDAPPEVAAIVQAAVMINGPLYGANIHLCFVFVARMVRLCLERGLGPWSPVSLATFALMLSAGQHDIAKVRLLTEVTLALFQRRFRSDSLIASLDVSTGGFITHRYEHLRNTLPQLREGLEAGLRSGEFEFAAYCAWWHAWHLLFTGAPLPRVETDARNAIDHCAKVRMQTLRQWSALVLQLTLNLQGKAASCLSLVGEQYDDERMLTSALEREDYAEVLRIKIYRAFLCFMFGSATMATALFAEAEAYLPYGVGLYVVPVFYFYDALANAAAHADRTPEEQQHIADRIQRNLAELEIWVRHAPMNHRHKQALIRAEHARLEGRHWDALALYQQAISCAAEQGFLQEEALACELCAAFLRVQGQSELAQVHAARARRLYAAWGAAPKVAQLDSSYAPWEASGPHSRTGEPSEHGRQTGTSTGQRGAGNLDLRSLLKAQQTLSQTVQLDELCAEMARLVLENAGAERAVLLYRDEGGWLVVGRGHVEAHAVEVGLRLPLRSARDLPQSIVHYVVRSGNAVVLSDASLDPQFAGDPYLRERTIRALLCLPVWHKGEIRLIAYLENNVTSGVFTEARLETLRLLSAQMAISMENALMYDRLETLVLRRTAELAEAKNRAEAASAAKSTFLTKMSHELRTPLNGILGYAQLLRQRSEAPDLLEGLDVIQRSGEQLLAMIRDLLDLAKTEAGRVELRPTRLRLRPFLQSVISVVRSRAEEKGLTLEWHAPSTLPNQVLVDEVQLRRVLLNLLSNAVKFTDRGGVKLTVESVGAPAPNAAVGTAVLRFTVSDSGPGLDPQDRSRIFLPFEQAGAPGQQAEGTGLGLAISQELVRLMGGELDVLSEPGRGCAFWFVITVPNLRDDSSQAMRAVAWSSGPGERPAGLTGNEEPSARVTPPPHSELVVLHDLALRGSLYRIMDRSAELERCDPTCQAFSRRLHELAKSFDERAVLAWVERFLSHPGPELEPGATSEEGVSR